MPNPLSTYILNTYHLVWLGWVLWHINHCRLFNAKSSFYIYIKYIWFDLVKFYSISTIVGYIIQHGLGVRVFANVPGDLGSIPGRVIPKTQKMVLDASLLSTQHYKVRIKGKVEQSRKGVAPSPTHWCSSYRKGSLRVTLDYGRQLYLLFIHIQLVGLGFIVYQPWQVIWLCGPGSNGNEGVLCICRNTFFTGGSSSDYLVSYAGHSFVGFLPLCSDAVGILHSLSRLRTRWRNTSWYH